MRGSFAPQEKFENSRTVHNPNGRGRNNPNTVGPETTHILGWYPQELKWLSGRKQEYPNTKLIYNTMDGWRHEIEPGGFVLYYEIFVWYIVL